MILTHDVSSEPSPSPRSNNPHASLVTPTTHSPLANIPSNPHTDPSPFSSQTTASAPAAHTLNYIPLPHSSRPSPPTPTPAPTPPTPSTPPSSSSPRSYPSPATPTATLVDTLPTSTSPANNITYVSVSSKPSRARSCFEDAFNWRKKVFWMVIAFVIAVIILSVLGGMGILTGTSSSGIIHDDRNNDNNKGDSATSPTPTPSPGPYNPPSNMQCAVDCLSNKKSCFDSCSAVPTFVACSNACNGDVQCNVNCKYHGNSCFQTCDESEIGCHANCRKLFPQGK